MNRIATVFLLVFLTAQIYAQDTNYQKNLKLATNLFLAKSEIPDSVLFKLVPENFAEFELFYGTTYPDNKMQYSGFFERMTQKIFDQVIVERKEIFYLLSLQLASFADGEFAETFIDNLEKIINLDKIKFCESIKGKKFADHNPLKYYAEQNKCK